MRTATAILLTILICINLFGFYAMFIVRQAEVKEEMGERISMCLTTNHNEVLTFNKTEFSQLFFNDNGKELSLNGRLYDVVSIENSGANIQVTVEYDSKETELVEAFGGLLSQQQDRDQNSSPVKTVISHFQQDYVSYHQALCYLTNTLIVECYTVNQSYPSSSFVADNLTPPPQFFLV